MVDDCSAESAWKPLTIRSLLIATVIVAVALFFSPVTAVSWVNVTGNLANMASECGNMSLVSATPGAGVIAGVAQKGLWINNSGTTWSHLGGGAGSDTITNRTSWIVYDPSNSSVFWESGIYNGGGVYKTTDNGNTFHQLGSITHIDYVSVDFSDSNRQTLIAGGHEQSQTVYRSTNGGQTWTNIGLNLPPNSNFSGDPLLLASQIYLVNTSGWGSGTPGVYRTTNGGTSWQQVSTSGPSRAPLVTANGTIYWASGGGLLKSTNGGVSWSQVGSNMQALSPIQLPNANVVAVGNTTLMLSSDNGTSWSAIGPALPYAPWGVTYSSSRQAFFIWRFDCGGVVLPDAIMMLDYATGMPLPAPPTNVRFVP
jgi:photosystem II stability/assembly factor-like uncharacterized protein